MTERTPVNLTNLDFFEIRENLKLFLKGQDEFSDYNFEGSGLSVLLDLLAYNTQNNAYLANMIANEAELDSAILRANVVSRAKLLGYTPRSTTAAKAVISVHIEDPLNTATSLVMPRGTKFKAGSGANQYNFITLQDYNLYLNQSSGKYENDEIEIFEGSIRTFTWDVLSGKRFIIPSKKIDTSTLKVIAYDNFASNEFNIYERAFGLTSIDSNSFVFWIQETDGLVFEIKFGDGVFGRPPATNGVVYAEYLESNGPDANDLSQFMLAGIFAGYEHADITITVVNSSSGGSGVEATSSIKLNAPRFFSAQNRAITREDFISLVNEVYPYARSVSVWPGDEVQPVQYGKVFVSIIPQNVGKLTSANKSSLVRKLKEKCVVGIQPVIVDPKFLNFNLTVFVNIKRNYLTNLQTFSDEIRSLIIDYFENEMGRFDNDFYYSNLLTLVETYSRAITSTKAEYSLSLVGSVDTQEFAFENSILEGSVRLNNITVTGDTISSNAFDLDGKIWSNNHEIGSVDYTSGLVKIYEGAIQETLSGTVEVFVTPLTDDVTAGFATALTLSEPRLAIELRAV